MNTSMAEETHTGPSPANSQPPKANKQLRVAPRGAHLAHKKAKSAQKATPAKKAPKGRKKAKSPRAGSKTNAVLELLQRPGGVTAQELMKATGWQAHSVRGFLSGTIAKKMGLPLKSSKSEDGERSYSVLN